MIGKAKAALARISGTSHVRSEYEFLQRRSEDVSVEDIRRSFPGKRIDVVNASAAIHHMPKDAKLSLLRRIQELSPRIFILTDADSDHESTLDNHSVELISNVYSFYTHMLECMMAESPNSDMHEQYRTFCYFDARDIIMGKDGVRIEYHTTAENWSSYLKYTGFTLVPPRKSWLVGIPAARCRIEREYLIPVFHRRPLIFQMVAKA
jgi:hypothetical protein